MWKPDSKVKYISRSGRESIRIIGVTAEGFAVIEDNGEEFLFSGNGKPINTMISPETGGPSIRLIKESNNTYQSINHQTKKINIRQKQVKNEPNYKKSTIDQPWDNIFAIKNLTVNDLNKLCVLLINLGYGNEKLHLKNFGKFANIEDKNKVRQLFLESKKIKARKEE